MNICGLKGKIRSWKLFWNVVGRRAPGRSRKEKMPHSDKDPASPEWLFFQASQ